MNVQSQRIGKQVPGIVRKHKAASVFGRAQAGGRGRVLLCTTLDTMISEGQLMGLICQ